MASVLLFVYGSLKRAGRHHDELAGARFLGEAETATGYAVVSLGEYPALVRAAAGSVVGELFELPEELLSSLDAFEGPEYERSAIEVRRRSGPQSRPTGEREAGQKSMALAYLKRSR